MTLCRWSVYVKKCHEMILFLAASALAFLLIRFMIDEYTKCGSILCVQHYVEGVHTLLGDFKKLDPFILFALAYAGFYILSSGSFSPPPPLCGFLRHRQSYSVSVWSLC